MIELFYFWSGPNYSWGREESRGWCGTQTIFFSKFNSSVQPLLWEASEGGWLPPLHWNFKGEDSGNTLFHDNFWHYLFSSFGFFSADVHLKQSKCDWFSLFPHYFNLFPNLSSPTFFHSHYPELLLCMNLHVLMSLSSLFLLMSNILFPATLICSVFPLQLSVYNCNPDLFWFPSLSLFTFFFQLHWMFLSLTISFSSLWKLLVNNTMQNYLLIIDHLAAVQICTAPLNTCAIQFTLFLYNVNKKGCILEWKYRKSSEQIISYFESKCDTLQHWLEIHINLFFIS